MDIRHRNGQTAELFVAFRLAEMGWTINRPWLTQCDYDILIEHEKDFRTIQVKKASWSKAGKWSYLQSRLDRDHEPVRSTADYFALTDCERVWLIKTTELVGLKSVCLGSTNPDYKPYTKYRADDWLI